MITQVICSVLIRAFGMMPSEFTRIQLLFLIGWCRSSIFRLEVVSSGRFCSLMQFSLELIRMRSNEWSNAWSNEWCFCSFELNNRRLENRAATVLSIGDELKLSLKLANLSFDLSFSFSLYFSPLFCLSVGLVAKPSGHMFTSSGLVAWIFDCSFSGSTVCSLPVDWSLSISRSFDSFLSVANWSAPFKNFSAGDNWSLPNSCSLLKKSSSLLANCPPVSLTHRSLVACSVRRWSNQIVRIIQTVWKENRGPLSDWSGDDNESTRNHTHRNSRRWSAWV